MPRPDAELGRIFETTDKAPTHLSVVLKSGAHHELRVDYPRGCPQNPATRAELEAKFEALAAPVLPATQIQRVKETFFALEEVTHIGDVVDLLCRQESQRGTR